MPSTANRDRLATLRAIADMVAGDVDGDLPCPTKITMGDYPSGGGYLILELAPGDEPGVGLWANLFDLPDPEIGSFGADVVWYAARLHLTGHDDEVWMGWRTVEVLTYLKGRS